MSNVEIMSCANSLSDRLINTDDFVVPPLLTGDDNIKLHDLIILYYDVKNGDIGRNEAAEKQKIILGGK